MKKKMPKRRQGPLHVAILIGALTKGGAERVVVNLANYLVENEYQVTMVTQYQKEDEYPLNPDVKRVLSDIVPGECSRSHIINFKRRFCKLRNIWKQEKPDVILSFIGKNNFMAILTSRFLKIPVAVSVRGDPAMEYYNWWMRFMARHLFKIADGVILQTKLSYAFFPKKVREKAVILKNLVSPFFFRMRYEGERDKELVAVGRIDANKNHEMLIRAFADIAWQYPEYRLTIYGEGELRGRLTELVSELGMMERIRLPGAISDIPEAIYKAHAFILPSNTEGVPNTLIEAMILGLTVISTDCPCGGPAELIEHGVNGLLTPVGDAKKMRDSLQIILGNLCYSDELGKNASKISDIYRPEKINKEWENYLYSLALGRK